MRPVWDDPTYVPSMVRHEMASRVAVEQQIGRRLCGDEVMIPPTSHNVSILNRNGLLTRASPEWHQAQRCEYNRKMLEALGYNDWSGNFHVPNVAWWRRVILAFKVRSLSEGLPIILEGQRARGGQ